MVNTLGWRMFILLYKSFIYSEMQNRIVERCVVRCCPLEENRQ